jgi:hypothetical protein
MVNASSDAVGDPVVVTRTENVHAAPTAHDSSASAVDKVTAVEVIAAFAGTTDNRPKPNADTATSAMRLIDVFVDICFLSKKVEIEDFSRSAGRLRTHSSDMSEPFLSWG